MSRAINVTLTEAEVQAQAKDIRISAIETLPSGGTHFVCVTSEEAEEMRQRLKKHIIEGRVRRFPFFNVRQNRY